MKFNFVLEKHLYHEMAAAQVAKKLKDKRKQRTIEGIFKKVQSQSNLTSFLFGPTDKIIKFNSLIFKYRNIFREC